MCCVTIAQNIVSHESSVLAFVARISMRASLCGLTGPGVELSSGTCKGRATGTASKAPNKPSQWGTGCQHLGEQRCQASLRPGLHSSPHKNNRLLSAHRAHCTVRWTSNKWVIIQMCIAKPQQGLLGKARGRQWKCWTIFCSSRCGLKSENRGRIGQGSHVGKGFSEGTV